ncbi:MAG: alpha/beta hydrolase family esterase [Flavobacteriaceae bacterium]|jgi:polyhydroxybutyrate depolymerase|tara:strand:- start:1463 stop:2344 length:882 start_codon:yes stop_codon:yes gene_type:complete
MKEFFLISMMIFIGCNSSQNETSELNDSSTPNTGLSTQTLQHNGDEREYQLYLPSSYNEETAHPVLLNFHGFGQNAKGYFANGSNFQEVANQEGVILVYPQALLLSGFSVWNAAPFAEDNKTDFDDIGFIETLIVDLQEQLSIDPERVYAAGFSTGGMFGYALACFSNEPIAGVAAISAAQLNLVDCEPSPTNAFIAHGTADDVLPYYGSSDIASIDEVVSFWNNVNQTSTVAQESSYAFGKETVYHYTYSEGINNTQVMHYKVENGSHGWFDHEIEGQSFTSLLWAFLTSQQ